jgi:hypothetical protein
MGVTLEGIEVVEGQLVVKLRDMNVADTHLTVLKNDL